MNPIHNVICSSRYWRRRVERELVPWATRDLELGSHVLELGPGFGASTRALVEKVGRLDVLELNKRYCERLQVSFGSRLNITRGDATSMPYGGGTFSAVLCFTMLHHVPTPELQDRVFGEAARVLVPGGVFAGTDSIGTGRLFELIHIGDTLVPVDPDGLPDRLRAAGLPDAAVDADGGSFRFRAWKPR